MAKLWQFLQGHPKPAFSEKVQKGDQGKFFKNWPKRCPHLKGPKALWRKWHYPLNSMRLNCKDWRRFRRKKRLQKCPNGQVIAIFVRSPKNLIFWKGAKEGVQTLEKIWAQNPHILKKCKKGTKNRPKGFPRLKGPKAVWRKWHYPLISMHLKSKDWKRFRQ